MSELVEVLSAYDFIKKKKLSDYPDIDNSLRIQIFNSLICIEKQIYNIEKIEIEITQNLLLTHESKEYNEFKALLQEAGYEVQEYKKHDCQYMV